MFYVYILRSLKDDGLYAGYTEDLKKRVALHKSGKIIATKHRTPVELIYYEGFVSKGDAKTEEKFLKTGKGRERLKYLLKDTLT